MRLYLLNSTWHDWVCLKQRHHTVSESKMQNQKLQWILNTIAFSKQNKLELCPVNVRKSFFQGGNMGQVSECVCLCVFVCRRMCVYVCVSLCVLGAGAGGTTEKRTVKDV